MPTPIPGVPGAVMRPLDPEADLAAGHAPGVMRRQTITVGADAPVAPAIPAPIVTTRSAGSQRQRILRRLDALEAAARASDDEVDVAELLAIVRAIADAAL